MSADDLDVLVIGAGISGIGAAYRLNTQCPGRTFAVLEGRDAIGGTWDLFRYPGIRSDSDMYTLSFPFRPWNGDQTIADGEAIRKYIEETARELDLERHIRFGHRVERASWSSDAARWTVEARRTKTGERVRLTCRFLFMCTGYYDYTRGYTPDFPDVDRYRGRVVHPQAWTNDVEHAGKRVVVIGSGATAVGLVPALADKAAHVTMLQRSPTYMMALPAVNPLSRWVERRVPKVGYDLSRTLNVVIGKAVYAFCRARPEAAKRLLVGGVRKKLDPSFDVETHFTPRYHPWDQRLCLVRNGDLFAAIREGKVDVVTDHVERFTDKGIRLRSGRELEADLVVTATGLELQLVSGIPIVVDGRDVDLPKTTMYKAAMLSGVPNLALSLGYVNASWTLRSDLIAQYVCRLVNDMDRHGYRACTPTPRPSDDVSDETVMPLASGYVERARAKIPRQGKKHPWRTAHGYLRDLVTLRYLPIDDGMLQFTR